MQRLIAEYTVRWRRIGQWIEPGLSDTVCFMVTEATEALQEIMRFKPYPRNNPRQPSMEALCEELADTIIMATYALSILGESMEEQVSLKLRKMNATKMQRYEEQVQAAMGEAAEEQRCADCGGCSGDD